MDFTLGDSITKSDPEPKYFSADTYVKADLSEVAAALAVLTGEPHPLVPG